MSLCSNGSLCAHVIGLLVFSARLAKKIENDVLSEMYCNGKQVSKLVRDQIADETHKEDAWILPVTIGTPIAFVFLIAILTFIGKLFNHFLKGVSSLHFLHVL